MENMDVSTDSEVQFRNGAAVQSFTEEQDEASGDNNDMLTHGVLGSDADDEDSRSGHACFSEDYVEEAESDVEDEPHPDDPTPPAGMDAQDAQDTPGPQRHARPRNRGSRRQKEHGPGNQKHIVNFDRDEDYRTDRPVWRHGFSFPRDTVQVPDHAFHPEPTSQRSNGLLFNLTGFQPLDFFCRMWPCELFDYIADETNRHHDAGEDRNRQCSEYSFMLFTLFL